MRYWVVVVAKNAAGHISSTLDSLITQTLKPQRILIVDDGSTDSTARILARYATENRNLICLTLPDKGYDIRRVPQNINLAWRRASATDLRTDLFMISGDDCTYPRNYASQLISRMSSNPRLMVVSGRPTSGSREHSPSGSGRMIRCNFWREIGEAYPTKAGWETWLLYMALQRGEGVKLYDDLIYGHERPRGAKHQFLYWGAAMHGLGYHPLYALGRIAKNVATRKITVRGSLNMLRGYLLSLLGSVDPFISPFDDSLRKFVRMDQAREIARMASLVLSRAWRK